MRLGQLSRKLDIKPTEIREFIRNEFKIEIDLDLNTRIEDLHADAVEKKYTPIIASPKLVVEKVVPQSQISESITEEETLEEKEASEQHSEIHSPIEIHHFHATKHPEPIQNDEPKSNIDPFIPLPVDPDAEIIKVPKIKLEGLKVVGKIKLPAKKEKSVEENSEVLHETTVEVETITTSEDAQVTVADAKSNPELKIEKKDFRKKTIEPVTEVDEENSIYKDKRGIYHFSQTQRENRKNSLERLKCDKQESIKKKNKAQHYQQVVVKEKKVESASVKAKKQIQRETKNQPEKIIRKGLWGKFLNWLNG